MDLLNGSIELEQKALEFYESLSEPYRALLELILRVKDLGYYFYFHYEFDVPMQLVKFEHPIPDKFIEIAGINTLDDIAKSAGYDSINSTDFRGMFWYIVNSLGRFFKETSIVFIPETLEESIFPFAYFVKHTIGKTDENNVLLNTFNGNSSSDVIKLPDQVEDFVVRKLVEYFQNYLDSNPSSRFLEHIDIKILLLNRSNIFPANLDIFIVIDESSAKLGDIVVDKDIFKKRVLQIMMLIREKFLSKYK